MTAPAFKTADQRAWRAKGERPRLPPPGAVLLEQVRATGFALRLAGLIAAAVVALVTLVVALQSVSLGAVVNLYQWPTAFPGLVGALLPIAVWARDERFGPGFLWTLPVDRRRHAVTKVFAGWVWLMGGSAVFALWLLAVTLASGGRVLPPETLHVLATQVAASAPLDPAPLDPAALRTVRWAPGLLLWVVPFTAATACYLLASAFVLGSRHLLRWVIGIVLSYALLSVASDAASVQLGVGWLADTPGRLVRPLVEGRYGLDALLTARTNTLSTTATLATGDRAVVWRAVPYLADWLIATLLWTSAGLIALWAAASRHREQRRA
jgi:hypothetical protein